MDGKGPYRIYDPGGSEVRAREEAGGGSSYRQLLEENSILRERMKGLKSLGTSPETPPQGCGCTSEILRLQGKTVLTKDILQSVLFIRGDVVFKRLHFQM